MAYAPYCLSFILPLTVLAGNLLGSGWTFGGLFLLFILYPILDIALGERQEYSGVAKPSKVIGEGILFLHVAIQMATVGTLLWRAYQEGPIWSTFVAALSTGALSGASGIIVAHELGHRRPRSFSWWLSQLNLLSTCYTHYTIEHNHNHHLNVGTDADPASVPAGRGLWRQIIHSIPGQAISAWKIGGRTDSGLSNLVLRGWALQMLLIAAIVFFFSWWTAFAFVLQSVLAVLLLEYVNYIRHYGLRRGGNEKQTEQHSWQTESRWTGWTLFEVSLHPDHHMRASLPYWAIGAVPNAPKLPVGYYGLFWPCVFPKLWSRWMDPKVPRQIDS